MIFDMLTGFSVHLKVWSRIFIINFNLSSVLKDVCISGVLVHITHPVTVINKYLQKILGSDLPKICLSFTNICKMLRKQFDNEKCCWVQCPRLALTCFTSARCPGKCWMLLLHVAVHADCVSPTWLECFILLYEGSIQKTLCKNLLNP